MGKGQVSGGQGSDLPHHPWMPAYAGKTDKRGKGVPAHLGFILQLIRLIKACYDVATQQGFLANSRL